VTPQFFAALAAIIIAGASSPPLVERAATAPVQQPAGKTRALPVPFAPGETLTYDVSWSSYITAGTATLSVKERRPSYGSEAYYIIAEGRPTPLLSRLYDLYYKADTLMDVATLLPQRGSIFSKENQQQRMKITMFHHRVKKAQYEVQTRTVVKKDVPISAHTQDVLGALYVIRAIRFAAGESFTVPICDAGETYTLRVTVGAVENVKTGIGEVRAFRLTPVLPPSHSAAARRLTVWLSEDARRLPVRMQAQLAVGSFDLTLRSAVR
jgi:hypothetical protein